MWRPTNRPLPSRLWGSFPLGRGASGAAS
eukprot:COSAG01_NODE_17285_length_1163_cov_5.090226_1_plen_28_part_10